MNDKLLLTSMGIWGIGVLWAQIYHPEIPETSLTKPFEISISALGIFLNNLKVIMVNISGLISSGIITFFTLLLNGYVFGLILHNAIEEKFSFLFIGAKIIPHFPEYIAIWLSGGVGLSGIYIFRRLNHMDIPLTKSEYILLLKYILLSILLIFIAAYTEKYISLASIFGY